MRLKIYQLDAFAEQVFRGNPAAVCILDKWIDDDLMQNIAAENNLAETAFAVKKNDFFEIRWFTPTTEVDLCGHATLATAFVLFEYYNLNSKSVHLESLRSGKLMVSKLDSGELSLDFPADEITEVEISDILKHAFKKTPQRVLKGKTDYLLIYPHQEDIESIDPDLSLVSQIDARGIIISAKGEDVDFVSRFFAPQSGVDEDPVTGSAHTTLIPYWSKILNKKVLTAKQLSRRGGILNCHFLGDRVKISGYVAPYLIGDIEV